MNLRSRGGTSEGAKLVIVGDGKQESGRVKLREIVFDCQNPAMLARFWAELLDDFEVRGYDAEEIARLADHGLTPETDPAVMVDGPGLQLGFQKADLVSMAKNKVHLDLTVERLDVAVDTALALGAILVESFEQSVWLQDPEGNDFCLTEWE